ncbi:MAG TPA: DegT/DnrJ/EryC1/StrS family aminotransferase [Candidatus Paceibacterota bacterium]|nr:DegT/DnrJ/EryC1/StrS family aminotransferase [Candidatus Paceibacterota bacterium]
MLKLIKSTFYREKETREKLAQFVKKTKRLSFSDECQVFENSFSRYQGRKRSIFFNSGSSANLALMQALLNTGMLKKGDKVGFSAVTWSTNVMPLIQLGLVPVPVDVELETLNVSTRTLKAALKEHKLNALFITNLLGFSSDIGEIAKLCRGKKIILLEDNCEALGSVYKKKKLGNFGLASTFSFFVGHHMSTIEGGMVCTDDKELAEMLGIVRAHGWDRNLKPEEKISLRKRFKKTTDFYAQYTFYDLGYNLRPTEIQGFLGNIQLKFLPEIIRKRSDNFKKISKAIYKRSDLYYPLRLGHMDFISNFAVPVICRSREIRDELVEKCKNSIEVRPVVGGDIVNQPFFRKYSKIRTSLPVADLIHEQGIYFGNNPDMTGKEIEKIIKIFTSL